jgi:hypothetical protein
LNPEHEGVVPKPMKSRPPNAPLAGQLRDALGRVPMGKTGREPSALREHVAAVFDQLAAERERGATWDGLAAPFAALGILTAEKKAPTGVDLKNAWHAERYARQGGRPRRKARAKAEMPASTTIGR